MVYLDFQKVFDNVYFTKLEHVKLGFEHEYT